jgi:Uma2 family endonuclease
MPVYGRHGVGFLWLIDPSDRTLEVYRLESGKWLLLAAFAEDDKVRAEPFQEIEISLGQLWME